MNQYGYYNYWNKPKGWEHFDGLVSYLTDRETINTNAVLFFLTKVHIYKVGSLYIYLQYPGILFKRRASSLLREAASN